MRLLLLCLLAGTLTAVPAPYSALAVVAGSGETRHQDGPFGVGSFMRPEGLALDAKAQRLYVADADANAIRVVLLDKQQRLETLAGGGARGLSDGAKALSMLAGPTELALWEEARSLLFIDQDRRAIRVVGLDDGAVRTLTPTVNLGAWVGLLRHGDGAFYALESVYGRWNRIDPLSGVLTLVQESPDLRNPYISTASSGDQLHAYVPQSGLAFSFKPPAPGAASVTASVVQSFVGGHGLVYVSAQLPVPGLVSWDPVNGVFRAINGTFDFKPRGPDGASLASGVVSETGWAPLPEKRPALYSPPRLVFDPLQARLIFSEPASRRVSALSIGLDDFPQWERRAALPKAPGHRRYYFVGTSFLLWERKSPTLPAGSFSRRFELELGLKAFQAGCDWVPESHIYQRGGPWYAGSALAMAWVKGAEAKRNGMDRMVVVLDQEQLVQQALGFSQHRCEDDVAVDPMDAEWKLLPQEEKVKDLGPLGRKLYRIYQMNPERFNDALAGDVYLNYGAHVRGLDDPEIRALGLQVIRKAVAKAAQASKANGLPLTVVYVAGSGQVEAYHPGPLAQNWGATELGRLCREFGIDYIDLSPEMRAFARTLPAYYDGGPHMGPEGHAWVAKMLANKWPLDCR